MESIDKIRRDLENMNPLPLVNNILENAESNLAEKIKNTGDTTARTIYKLTPRTNDIKRGGKVIKKVKSSLKKNKKFKKSKKVRFCI